MADTIVLEAQDHWGRTIRLMEDVWNGHICSTHQELAGHLTSIQQTLIAPDIVCFDAGGRVDAECFYRVGAIPSLPHRYLKIAVRFPEQGENGFVHTAYISRNIPAKERLKWQRL